MKKRQLVVYASTPTGSGQDWVKALFRADDDEEWDEVEEEGGPDSLGFAESGDGPPESVGVFPVFTGLLNAAGEPVIRHPIRIRVGFHLEANKYHTPTAEDDADGSGSVVGWAYEF